MTVPKITGAQRDFSGGELNVSMKRADENPIMKIGARQLANWRILNSGAASNRSGRSARFIETGRVEKVLMLPGNVFYLVFGNGYLRVYNAAGTQVFATTLKGDGVTAIPWTTATARNVSFVVASGSALSIYIAYGDDAPLNVPQVLTWDGVSQASTWTLATYAETVTAGLQKRTVFTRISPKNVTMLPSATSGAISITFSAAVLVAGMVNTRMTFIGRQILITGVTSPTLGAATVEETLFGSEDLVNTLGLNASTFFNIGDVVKGQNSGASGIVTGISAATITVQLLGTTLFLFGNNTPEVVVGPNGSAGFNLVSALNAPKAVSDWDDEVMNLFRGYPTSVFFDQNRLGFCNFPPLPSGVGWSAIGLASDFYALPNPVAGVSPASAIFEFAPGKSQVLYVLPGMESSEFAFCDNAIYYIPISVTSPLQPGSVEFKLLTEQGCANVQPQPAQQSILYVKAGGIQIGAVQAPGAYYRPYVADDVSEYHSHLFSASPPIAIAVPSATTQFEETYAYILLANGSLVMGKYKIKSGLLDVGPEGKPKIGWLPWNGAGVVNWISAQGSDLVFTTTYTIPGAAAVSIVEALDATQYLDAAMPVNAAPAPFAPPGGKGPLWWLAGGTVTLMDQVTRAMGTYTIDANGFIVPQNNGGEDLTAASLVAGQPWTAINEPFVPDAQPGQDMHQRMFKRRVSRQAVYVSNSSGFMLARLFSGPITPKSPPLGTIMNTHRVPAYNMGDDATKPPPLREEAERWRPIGRSYDPRVAVIKDTPGPLVIHEIGFEVSV